MTARQQLTEQDLNDILNEVNRINAAEQRGEMDLAQALEEAKNARKIMVDTFDRSIDYKTEDPFRVKVWEKANGLVNSLTKAKNQEDIAKGPRVPADGILEVEDRNAIDAVRSLISGMRLNGKKEPSQYELRWLDERVEVRDGKITDEEYVSLRRSMLNDYGKGIDTKHPKMLELGQLYHNKTLSNYEKFAQEQMMTEASEKRPKRTVAFIKKIRAGIKGKKYSDPAKAATVVNLLIQALPVGYPIPQDNDQTDSDQQ